MDSATLLANSLSPDASTRQHATEQLEAFATENFAGYVQTLIEQLSNESAGLDVRNAAGLAIKNALTARDTTRQAQFNHRWLTLDESVRAATKDLALRTLGSPVVRAGSVASQVVSAIAAVELPAGQWTDLIKILLSLVGDQSNVGLRINTLQALGFICEAVKPEILSAQSNEILTTVVQGARKEEPSPEVQQAAITALYNSLEFVRDNFERDGERNYIMQVVCEATQNQSITVVVGAFECLVRIMQLYYDKMGFYMEQALFGLTVLGMNNPEETVALQAVEFWSTVCDEEIELAIEAAEAAEYNEAPERESKNFAKVALPQILPVLLQLLTQQEEDADDDEWNVSMAAGTCLALLAQAVGDDIVPGVIPFVEAGIKASASPEAWHQREAAVMAFGSILDGPDPRVLAGLVSQALPTIIEMMQDPNVHVKDSAAWTLGRISDILIDTIKEDVHLGPLIAALVYGLDDSPRVVGNCCWSLMNLAEQLGVGMEEDPLPATTALSPFYEGVISALMRVTAKYASSNESNARTPAYEAISTYVTQAAADSLPIVSAVTLEVLTRMEALVGVQNQLVGSDDRNNWNELQGNLCSVITSVVRKLGKEIRPLSDRIMTVLLQLCDASGKQAAVFEDALLAIGAVTSALEQDFAPYLPSFLPYLATALQAQEEYQLCSIAVGLIGDICRALGESSAQYCNEFMNALLKNLQSELLHRSVKPPILSCFGDVALAIGPAFAPYLETVMAVLEQAGQMRPDPSSYELVEYVTSLREGIIEAYVGVVSAFRSPDQNAVLLPYVPSMLALLQLALEDEDRSDAVVKGGLGLLGDVSEAFPRGEIKELLLHEWVATVLKTGRGKGMSAETRKLAKWTREAVKHATA